MAENYQKLSKLKQVELLEATVVRGTPADVSDILKKLGKVELSARALGIACRFKGLEWVKALINGGASFKFHLDGAAESKYGCYNRTIFESMLFDAIPESDYMSSAPELFRYLEDSMGYRTTKEENGYVTAYTLDDTVFCDGNNEYQCLPQSERLGILEWLIQSGKFDAGRLLFLSMLGGNEEFFNLMRKHNCSLPPAVITGITTGKGSSWAESTWDEEWNLNGWLEYLRKGDVDSTIKLLRTITPFLNGEKVFIGNGFFSDTSKRDGRQYEKYDNQCLCESFIRFAFTECNCDKVNKKALAEFAIEKDDTGILSILADNDAFKSPTFREAMLDKASKENRVQSLAFLLNYKNEKVDIKKEQENREQREMRELTQSPTSAAYLRKVWSVVENEDGTLCLTNYKGEGNVRSSTVAVPETIGKKVVTRLAGTFDGFRDLKEITLPDSIIEIGRGTFRQCNSLEKCNAPRNLKIIGKHAFEGCSSLKEFDIPATVEKIEGDFLGGSFERCKSLTHITIPNGVKKIEMRTFQGCSSLEKVIIPDSVGIIECEAFSGCVALTDVSLGSNEITIDKSAFSQVPWYNTQETIVEGVRYRGNTVVGYDKCVPEEVELRSGTTIIGKDAFRHCGNIKKVILPEGVERIENYAFDNCKKLEVIQLPGSLKVIAEGAFCSCGNIKKVVLPEGVERIEDYTFSNCKNLEVIQLPDSIKVIAKGAFRDCGNLITVLGSRSDIEVAGGAFSGSPIPYLTHVNKSYCSFHDVEMVYQWLRTTGTVWDQKEELEDYAATHYIELLDAITAQDDSIALNHLCTIIDPLIRSGQKTEKELVSEFEVRLFHSPELMRVFEGFLAQWVQVLDADQQIKGSQLLQSITMSEADAKKVFKVSKTGLSEGECAISGYKGTDSIVIIPAMIGNNKVVEIREGAFYVASGTFNDPCNQITRVYIPKTVRCITKKTFSRCRNLRCVFIPDSVHEIGIDFSMTYSDSGITLFVVKGSVAEEYFQKLKANTYTRWNADFKTVSEYPFIGIE